MSDCKRIACVVFVIALAWALAWNRTCVAQAAEKPSPRAVAQETQEAAQSEGAPNPLAFSTDLAIWTLVVFIVLVLVLGKFAWPQISQALEERERKIADAIAAAEAQHEQAKRLLAEHEAKLAAAAGEVRGMLDEARRDAESVKQRIEADGRKAAQEELERAVREIARARDAATQDLAERSANVAIDLAQKIIREQLTPEKNNQIVRDAVAKLAAAPSNN